MDSSEHKQITSPMRVFHNFGVYRSRKLDRYVRDFSVRKLVRRAAELEASAFTLDVQCQYFAWYDSRLNRKHPALGSRDLVREMADECRRYGLKCIGYFPAPHLFYVGIKHPEWAQLDPDGTPVKAWPGEQRMYTLCLNSPAREFLKGQLTEVMTAYGLDGAFIDGLISFRPYGICNCPWCRRKFRRQTGFDLPRRKLVGAECGSDRELQRWAAHRRWCYDQFKEWMLFIQDVCHRARPGSKVIINIGYARELGLDVADCRLIDHPCCEQATGSAEHVMMAEYQMLRFRQQSAAPTTYIYGNPITYIRNIPYRCHSAIARNILVDAAGAALDDDRPFNDAVKLAPYLGGRTAMKGIALLHSQQTLDFYGGPKGNDKGYTAQWALYNLLRGMGKPLSVIDDVDLNEKALHGHALLILNNAELMSDAAARAVTAYVRGGGAVLATWRTSLLRENGVARKDFGLKELMGATCCHKAVPKVSNHPMHVSKQYIERLGGVLLCRSPGGPGIPGPILKLMAQPMLFRGPAVEVRAPHRPDVVAQWGPDASAPAALVIRKFGKGRVAYCSADHAAVLKNCGGAADALFEELARLLADSLPVEVSAPRSVEALFYERKAEKQIVIHLLNSQGPEGLTAPDVAIVIRDVRIARAIKQVRLMPEDTPLRIRRQPGRALIPIGNLQEHALIVISM